jgi:hypothetical protein
MPGSAEGFAASALPGNAAISDEIASFLPLHTRVIADAVHCRRDAGYRALSAPGADTFPMRCGERADTDILRDKLRRRLRPNRPIADEASVVNEFGRRMQGCIRHLDDVLSH